MPPPFRPMLLRSAPTGALALRYAYEVKWDGFRALVELDTGSLRLWTRNGNEVAGQFPELNILPQRLSAPQAVLDGELVSLGPELRPDFARLLQRIRVSRPSSIAYHARTEPVVLILFDALRVGNEDLRGLPWEERRRRLESLVTPCERVQLSPVFHDLPALWQVVNALGLEGVVAKSRSGRYTCGKRSDAWLKIKTPHARDLQPEYAWHR